MKIAQLVVVSGLLVVLASSLSPVCRPPCRCRNGALDCSRAAKLTSLPDLSTYGFVSLKLRGTGLLELDCTHLPPNLRLLDIRSAKISLERSCELLNCRRVSRIKMSHTCPVSTTTTRSTEAADSYYAPIHTSSGISAPVYPVSTGSDAVAPSPAQWHTTARGPDPPSTVTARPMVVVTSSNVTGTLGVVFALLGVVWGLCNCVYYNMRFRKLRADLNRQARASDLPMQMSELRAPDRRSRLDRQSQVQQL